MINRRSKYDALDAMMGAVYKKMGGQKNILLVEILLNILYSIILLEENKDFEHCFLLF